MSRFDTERRDRLLDVISVQTTLKYEGYSTRQEQAVTRAQAPSGAAFPKLSRSTEFPACRARWSSAFRRPGPKRRSGPAHPGVTPAAVAVIGAYLNRF